MLADTEYSGKVKMKFLRFSIAAAFALSLLTSGGSLYSVRVVHAHHNGQETQPQKPTFQYVCPMHDDVTSKKPGNCYKCKMKLEKKRVKEPKPQHQ